MVLLSLVALGCLSAWRDLWAAEQRLNLEADQLRGLHRAEAVLPLAVADILGPSTIDTSSTNLRHTATPNAAFFPNNLNELATLQQHLGNACEQGICAPSTPVNAAHSASHWWALREQAIRVPSVVGKGPGRRGWPPGAAAP